MLLVYALGGPFSAWIGRLGGRHGLGRMMTASLALELAGLALTAAPSLAISIVAIAMLTCGFFGAHAIASGWVSRRAARDRAAAASLYLFAYYVGSSVFGSLGGLFYARAGWPGIMGLVGGLILAALGVARALTRREARAMGERSTCGP